MNIVNRIFRKIRRTLFPVHDENYFLTKLSRQKQPVTFLQIGAHDGKTDDHLFSLVKEYEWRGVLVEPVDYLFAKLKENYRGIPSVSFENRAIAKSSGVRKFYRLRENSDGLPDWYDQLGSFNKDVVLKHKEFIPNIENYLVEQDVECVSVSDMLKTHKLSSIDLILVDTEGSDFEVLQSIDFQKIRPEYIIYEDKHLQPQDKAGCETMLQAAGYNVTKISVANSLAIKQR